MDTPNTARKICQKCNQNKPRTSFHKRVKSRDGLRSWCKACVHDYQVFYANTQLGPPKFRMCTKCGVTRTISEFYKYKKGKFGLHSWCKECVNKCRPPRTSNRYLRARAAAKRHNRQWYISEHDYDMIMNMGCTYCGYSILDENYIGIDIIDGGSKYTLSNTTPCCRLCADTKHGFYTYDDMIELGKVIKTIRARRSSM